MASHTLFESITFTMECPEPFNDASIPRRRTDVTSVYCPASAKMASLHAPTLRAILAYMRLFKATTDGVSVESLGALGTQNDKKIIAEYISGRGEIQAVVYNKEKNSLVASVYANETASGTVYCHKSKGGNATGSAILFAAIPVLMEDQEFKENYDKLYEQFASEYPDPDAASDAAFILCDNVYRRISNPKGCASAGVTIDYPESGNVRTLTELAVKKGTYSATDILMGEFKIVKAGIKPKASRIKISSADFVGKYKMTDREFTEKEQSLIPELPSWYLIPEQVATICEFAQKTTETNLPMRNFMLRGAAGSGKTEGAKAIAAGLGIPYVHLTCSADNEIFDFVGQILPNIEGLEFADPKDSVYVPSISEIDSDPVGAYYNMTGNYDDTVTAEFVKDELAKQLSEEDSKQEKKDKKDFRYVYTPLVEAIKYGYLLEIQEPTVIAKQGVLVGLNSLLDNCKAITLPTGERIERHPDTVIVITTNTDYEGCRSLNQSIISRMNLIFDMDTPDAKVMTERVMGITGCSDKSIVMKMAETIEKIAKKCREDMILDGSCGFRELLSWVQSYMICEDALAAAEYTVLSSVSADGENRDAIKNSCINPVFETA